MMSTLTIGQLAKVTKMTIAAIRYYETHGLIEKPAQNKSGYRQYTSDFIPKLRFIKNAKELGFTLKEITELQDLQKDASVSCKTIKKRAIAKIDKIQQRIDALDRIKQALTSLKERCPGKGPIKGCPIFEALNKIGGQDES